MATSNITDRIFAQVDKILYQVPEANKPVLQFLEHQGQVEPLYMSRANIESFIDKFVGEEQ